MPSHLERIIEFKPIDRRYKAIYDTLEDHLLADSPDYFPDLDRWTMDVIIALDGVNGE